MQRMRTHNELVAAKRLIEKELAAIEAELRSFVASSSNDVDDVYQTNPDTFVVSAASFDRA